MGTPDFAVPSLEALRRHATVLAVVTQPGRPRGRGLKETPSPVAATAAAMGLTVLTPEKIRDPAFLQAVKELAPDAIVVAAYGKILPRALLEAAPLGGINVHASLLPRHRGAAPIPAAILAGDTVTGITIMQMNERMDAGDILLQKEMPIAADETSGTLHDKLKVLGAQALAEALSLIRGPGIEAVPQDESLATLAPLLKKEAGEINWEEPARVIERKVRAYSPWPSAFTKLGGRHVKILSAQVREGSEGRRAASSPGTLIVASAAGLEVTTGDGILIVKKLQLEGRKPLEAGAFLAGARLEKGTRLG